MKFVVQKPTPILNTPHFSKVFGIMPLPFDANHLIRAVEMIALPGMSFDILREERDGILEVKSEEYPAIYPIYIDSRFGSYSVEKNEKKLPPVDKIIDKLVSSIGLPYVWGGNFSAGIPTWTELYPPPCALTPLQEAHWNFRGLDCSGLLYEATNGYTPRNTRDMFNYGREVTLKEIQALDLILYPGHVVIVLNENEVIESKLQYKVVKISPLESRLKEIDEPFTIRRFLQTP